MDKKEIIRTLQSIEDDITTIYNKIEDAVFSLRKVAQDVEYLRNQVEDEPEKEDE